MPIITQSEQIVQYTGPAVLISSLPYLANIRRISRANQSGKGYVSVVPGSIFPPFTWLETGAYYAISSLQPGYTIPDAPAGVAAPSPEVFSNAYFDR